MLLRFAARDVFRVMLHSRSGDLDLTTRDIIANFFFPDLGESPLDNFAHMIC